MKNASTSIRAQTVYELRREYKISELVKAAEISRSTYYYHIKQMTKPDKYKAEKDAIRLIHAENNGRYGYRRITATLHQRGFHINHKTVRRLMKSLGIFCTVRIRKYSFYRVKCTEPPAPNLLKRDFRANKPNEKWVTDITEISLCGQRLYFSPILDLYNGEIISYSISHRPKHCMIIDMLEKAFAKIPDDSGLVLHSDQGWHYRIPAYMSMLTIKGIRQSMSRKGNCLDNAVMENFFGHMKSEVLYLQQFTSVESFIRELHKYIKYYNLHRIKSNLDYLSPVDYRLFNSLVA